VTEYPRGFVPDLRRLRSWPSLGDSLWRNPDLVALTYAELALLVRTSIGSAPCSVLYVGPGLGHVALELARDGHDVTGIDIDDKVLAFAKRAAEADPFRETRGRLSYDVIDFPIGFHLDRTFETVLFCRVLHHLEDPAAAVAKAAELLSPDGRVVCVDFAHDRLGVAGARWMARSRISLSRAGRWPEPVSGSLQQETDKTAREWRIDHEGEGLNPFKAMLDPLLAMFNVETPAWHPYLFWELAADMRVPADEEGAVARGMHDEESSLLLRRGVQGVLFSTTGTKRTAADQ
jgi:SAM-dependent methyltransferase